MKTETIVDLKEIEAVRIKCRGCGTEMTFYLSQHTANRMITEECMHCHCALPNLNTVMTQLSNVKSLVVSSKFEIEFCFEKKDI